MQKLFYDCYDLDKRCYDELGLGEDILMENASRGLSDLVKQKFPAGAKVFVLAGPGNNGADGITAARQLQGVYDCKLCLPLGAKSPMAQLQLERAKAVGVEITGDYSGADVIIDALFGAGLDRPLEGELARLIQRCNESGAYKIACDTPSGIGAKGSVGSCVFAADVTVSMGAMTEGLFTDSAADFTGEVIPADLGISRQAYEGKTQTFVLQKSDFYPPYRVGRASHKGDFGHVNVLCGQKQGAGILAAQAAMNFGAGLVSLVTNESVQIPPFLMKDTHVSKNCTALAVGMGLGSEFLDQFLQSEVVDKTCRVVLDADGLDNKTLLTLLDQSSREVVLTPHPKEFSRLLAHTGIKKSVSEIQAERFETAREFSRAYPHTVLVLKGTYTLIAKDGQVYVNPFASARLSQGGSGDVLSGLIVSLLGQGYSAKEAAITGTLALSFAAGKFEGADYAMDAGDLVRLLKSELV